MRPALFVLCELLGDAFEFGWGDVLEGDLLAFSKAKFVGQVTRR